MVVLRSLILFILLLFPIVGRSIVIDEIETYCTNILRCDAYKNNFEFLKDKEVSLDELKNKIRYFAYEPSLKSFSYKVVQRGEKIILQVTLEKKLKVGNLLLLEKKINIDEDLIDLDELRQIIPIREGSYYNKKNRILIRNVIDKYLTERGISKRRIFIDTLRENDTVSYKIEITIEGFVKIKEVVVESDNMLEKNEIYFNSFLQNHTGKNWNKLKLKLDIDSLNNGLNEDGFYFSEIRTETEVIDEDNIRLLLKVKYGPQISFSIRGASRFSRQEFVKMIKDHLKTDTTIINKEIVQSIIKQSYDDVGIYKTMINIREEKGKTKFDNDYHFFFVDIKEGEQIKISSIKFNGFKMIEEEELLNLYYGQATTLADRDYLDQKYVKDFINELKKFYLARGFLFISIPEPKLVFNTKNTEVDVIYNINEHKITKLKEIVLNGIESKFAEEIKSKITNKEGSIFNVLELEKDIDTILNMVKENGYFYASFKSLQERDILFYNNDYTDVTLNLSILTNKETRLKSLVITGHETTRKYIIEREVTIEEGETITPLKILEVRNRLNYLGLFSTVKITPVIDEQVSNGMNNTNLLIHLTEKDFGLGEISLGYRTDTGIRGAIGVNYNNIDGRNWTASGKLESNYRLNLSTLDERRRNLGKKFIEWNANVGILFPYIGKMPIRTEFSTSHKKQRYFGFDAKIFTMQLQNSYDFGEHTSLSLKYQLDTVDQFEATNTNFNDKFKIGSITPSLGFDFRDDPINPRKGTYFGLSWEFANPSLGSNDDSKLIVNFDKIIFRNKSYLPFSPYYGLAFSFSAGKEVNKATDPKVDELGQVQYENGSMITKGYIPSIRVFRLDGQDSVRGFSDSEINLLETGADISSVVIQDSAYFMNMKLELRHFINDLMIAGMFVDAGRIYVNHFKPLDLRSSFGTTFKFVTPVGSLDFDYGVKFRRMRWGDDRRESFGRFHLSIGFF